MYSRLVSWAFSWLVGFNMCQPRILDQMITSIHALCPDGKHNTIKEATARMHPLDMLKLTGHIDSLIEPILFDVVPGDSEDDFTLRFIFDGINWTCIPDVNVPKGAPLIILQT